MSSELLKAEISYSREILRDICDHFAIDWDETLSIPEILNDKLLPELRKTKGYKNKNLIPIAKILFEIWRRVLKKPRSNYRDDDLRMIARLLQSGYSEAQIVQGILGLSKSEYHTKHGFYHIYYVVRSTNQLTMMIHKAEEHGFTEERCDKRLQEFIKNPGEFGSSTDSGYINPTTGKTIK